MQTRRCLAIAYGNARRAFPVFLVVAILLCAPAARGQETPEEKAKEHNKLGISYIDAGRFSEAVDEFKRAYEIAPAPKYLFNIGRTYQVMGKLRLCMEYFQRFADETKSDKKRAKALALIEEVKKQLAVLSLEIVPAQARVEVDGDDKLCRGNEECRLEAGEHNLRVSLPGYEPVSRTVRLEAGERRTEKIELVSNLTSISVDCTVAEAEVLLNGVVLGTCPVTKDGLRPGPYLVRVTHDEYKPQENSVTLKKGETVALSFTLEKKGQDNLPTRKGAIWRSVAFPGMGQYHAERKGPGTALLVSELVSVGATVAGIIIYYYGRGKKSEPGIDTDTWTYWDDYQAAGYWVAVGGGIAAGTVWLVNIIHAASMPMERPSDGARTSFIPIVSPSCTGFALTF